MTHCSSTGMHIFPHGVRAYFTHNLKARHLESKQGQQKETHILEKEFVDIILTFLILDA